MQEEILIAEKSIEAIISEDMLLTAPSHYLVLNSLSSSVFFVDDLINCMSTTHCKLTISRCSSKKEWHLEFSLTRRTLEDVYEPRIGVLKALRAKQETKVSTIVCYATLRIHTIMKE